MTIEEDMIKLFEKLAEDPRFEEHIKHSIDENSTDEEKLLCLEQLFDRLKERLKSEEGEVGRLSFIIGREHEEAKELQQELDECKEQVDRLNHLISVRDQIIEVGTRQLAECRKLESRRVQCDTELIDKLHMEIHNQNKLIDEYPETVENRDRTIERRGDTIKDQRKIIQGLNDMLKENSVTIDKLINQIEELNTTLDRLRAELTSVKSDRDIMFQNYRNTTAVRGDVIKELKVENNELKATLSEIVGKTVGEKEIVVMPQTDPTTKLLFVDTSIMKSLRCEVDNLTKQRDREHIVADEYRETVKNQENTIEGLEYDLSICKGSGTAQDIYIAGLKKTIEDLKNNIEGLEAELKEKDESTGRCVRRIGDHLQDKARMKKSIEELRNELAREVNDRIRVCEDCARKAGKIGDLEAELSARKQDSGVLTKVIEAAKAWDDSSILDRDSIKAMRGICNIIEGHIDAPEPSIEEHCITVNVPTTEHIKPVIDEIMRGVRQQGCRVKVEFNVPDGVYLELP